MCLEDIRIGRRSTIIQRTVTVATSSTLLVPPNPRRTGLIISGPLTNRITLSTGEAAVALNGIVLYPTVAPLQLRIADYGQLLTKQMFAIATLADETIGVWETILDWEGSDTNEEQAWRGATAYRG